MLKRVEQEKFNSFKWEWIKPEAGSTRPEMPPASKTPLPTWLKKYDNPEGRATLQKMFGGKAVDIRTWVKDYINNKTVDFDGDKLEEFCVNMLELFPAASVQQEPLSYPLKLNQAQLSTIDEWVNDPKNLFGDREARAINLPIFARQMLSCQPAAPRTQGREPGIIRCKTCSGTVMFKPLESGEIEIYHDCPDSKKLAQARTQPAPHTPACPTHKTEMIQVEDRSIKVWKCTALDCPIFISQEMIKAVQQFFTALPEATNEPEGKK